MAILSIHMRLNKFLAANTSLSRRAADQAIAQGRVHVNGAVTNATTPVSSSDVVALDGRTIEARSPNSIVVLLNKPIGYVCSKDGQGSRTVYDLLPPEYKDLNIAGRLDKDSSGLVALTNNGDVLYKLTHPSQNKQKIYHVSLDKQLSNKDLTAISKIGVNIGDDRPSLMEVSPLTSAQSQNPNSYSVQLSEGRNRQIRRTFAALGYAVVTLHRTHLGSYSILDIPQPKSYKII